MPAHPGNGTSVAVVAVPTVQAGTAAGHPDLSLLAPDARVTYRTLLKEGEGQVYALDPVRSDVRIYALRAGVGARFAHNHVLQVPHFSGLAFVPEKGLRGGSAQVAFRLADLTLDDAAMRKATGGSFAPPLSAADIAGTREHMLSEQNFQAERFPQLVISSVIEAGEQPVASADVAITLHGETHHQRVLLKVHTGDGLLDVAGSLFLRQSDYGVKPYTVMGGLIGVDDLVGVEFSLHGAQLRSWPE